MDRHCQEVPFLPLDEYAEFESNHGEYSNHPTVELVDQSVLPPVDRVEFDSGDSDGDEDVDWVEQGAHLALEVVGGDAHRTFDHEELQVDQVGRQKDGPEVHEPPRGTSQVELPGRPLWDDLGLQVGWLGLFIEAGGVDDLVVVFTLSCIWIIIINIVVTIGTIATIVPIVTIFDVTIGTIVDGINSCVVKTASPVKLSDHVIVVHAPPSNLVVTDDHPSQVAAEEV